MEIERKVDLGRGHRLERERQIWEREIAGQNKVDLGKGHRLERERDGREMGDCGSKQGGPGEGSQAVTDKPRPARAIDCSPVY